jgi:glycosyltransferase involved in cell wall biosynthesis
MDTDSSLAGEPVRRPVVALVVDAVHPWSRGGREIRYHELTRRLADRAEYHVYTMHWWDGPRVHEVGDVTFHAISPLFSMYHQGRRSLRQSLFFSACCFRLLWRRFDILESDHIPHLQVLVLCLVAAIRRKPFIVTWHEVWGRSSWQEYLGRWLGRVAWLIEWLAMRLPDRILAASHQTEEALRAVIGSRMPVMVAPNGIDLEAIAAITPHPAVTDLVVVGRLMPHKQVGMLLRAVARLHADGHPVTCRVIGDGPEREALRSLALDLGLGGAVDFRHDVGTQDELYALVKAARLFVFPSAREGFGAAALEALACGVPVVTTSAPGNLSQFLVVQSQRGIVCDPTIPALADAIDAALAASAGPVVPRARWAGDAWLTEHGWAAVSERVAQCLEIP